MIEAALIQAVIEQESGGSATAQSKAGAKGLMQLMDATGKEWHAILGIEDTYDPFNAQQNEKIGTAYLNWLLKEFDHDIQFALAAYNYGIGNIKKLIKRRGESFENIEPYLPTETRHYVRSVLGKRERILKA